jgi:hypothetical protein
MIMNDGGPGDGPLSFTPMRAVTFAPTSPSFRDAPEEARARNP